MTPRNRKRLGLLLLISLFLAPLCAAIVLNAIGWRPAGMRNYGELVEPPRPLKDARFVLADGKPLAWEDADWSWTMFVLTGPACADACLARIDELRRARLSLAQNAHRVRVVVLDPTLPADAIAAMAPVTTARDADEALASMRPADGEVAVAMADPHGFLAIHYAAGYDASRLRKDLVRLVKR
ncbi:MAG: hypothetical protein EOP90_06010 [Lysobacteraceae bacterium]|jgi:hypothetical protein|nr:MAG: hypothetical protein EOP90_06010 [Xanthomonadaceae bacterium]